uniref:Uncharacterized protein n=1 Tax=Clastoptera arizonana TaxID=38151 RepID=A0A1B6C0K7_9HEMI
MMLRTVLVLCVGIFITEGDDDIQKEYKDVLETELVDAHSLSKDPMDLAEALLKGFKDPRKDPYDVFEDNEEDIEIEKWTMKQAMKILRENKCRTDHRDFITVNDTYNALLNLNNIPEKPLEERIRIVEELLSTVKILRLQWVPKFVPTKKKD